jgi:hypothetical protein
VVVGVTNPIKKNGVLGVPAQRARHSAGMWLLVGCLRGRNVRTVAVVQFLSEAVQEDTIHLVPYSFIITLVIFSCS